MTTIGVNQQKERAAPAAFAPPQMLNDDLEILVKRIAESDEAALADLYDRTHRVVFSLLVRMVGDATTAEEILVEVYTDVWAQINLSQPGTGSVFAWLISLARSRALQVVRTEKGARRQNQMPDSICAEIAASANIEDDFISERQRLVSAALEKMPVERRQILELAYFACLTPKEIAERLGQDLETVQANLRAGMSELRERLRLDR